MRHDELGSLSGDVLIHCGDMFDLFDKSPSDLGKMDAWFSRQRFDLVLCIGGNHDYMLEDRHGLTDQPFKNATYLEDQSLVHNGIVFYGTPWVPFLRAHAFYADETGLREKWSGIPENTDVLITHTPPAGMFDRSSRGQDLGCRHLAERVPQVAPTVHCFGHVHASAGMREDGMTTYVNASCFHKPQIPLRPPFQIDLQTD